jgi:hypothetical protein
MGRGDRKKASCMHGRFPFSGKIHGVTFEFEGPGAELSLEERHEQALRME